MAQLVQLVVDKTGISEDHARTAVETVLGFLKDRLPGPISSQIDSALSGSGSGGIGAAAKKVGSLLGK